MRMVIYFGTRAEVDNIFMERKNKIFIGVVLCLALIGGFIVAGIKQGYFSRQNNSVVTVTVAPARIFVGNITEVDLVNSKLTLAVGGNMALDASLTERTVFFTEETPIVREKEKKDPQVFSAEVESYGKILQDASLSEEERNQKLAQMGEPEEYILEPVSAESLSPGMRILVFTDHDVMEEKEFTVEKIRVFYTK